MLSRSQAPEMETLITLCKTRSFVVNPEKILMTPKEIPAKPH
jgi:hypothetical protein